MTREEVKEEFLKDDEQQFKTTVAAQFTALYEFLIKKGVFTKAEIEQMNKSTEEYVEKINDIAIDAIMKQLNEED